MDMIDQIGGWRSVGGSGATGVLGETNSNFGGFAGYTGQLVGER